MTIMNMVRDANGLNTFGLPFSNYKYNTTLVVGVLQTLTVPTTGNTNKNMLAIFAPQVGATIWVSLNGTAALPGGSFALSTSESNPTARMVKSGDVLSFITDDDTATIGIIFYDLAI
jgi:hypothetical protein